MRTVVSPLITFRGMLDVYQPCTNGLDSVFQKEIAPLGSVGNDDKTCDRSWFGTQGMVWVSRSVFQLPLLLSCMDPAQPPPAGIYFKLICCPNRRSSKE